MSASATQGGHTTQREGLSLNTAETV